MGCCGGIWAEGWEEVEVKEAYTLVWVVVVEDHKEVGEVEDHTEVWEVEDHTEVWEVEDHTEV
jgi:hypothetical protein